jgi:hypothetical protein
VTVQHTERDAHCSRWNGFVALHQYAELDSGLVKDVPFTIAVSSADCCACERGSGSLPTGEIMAKS